MTKIMQQIAFGLALIAIEAPSRGESQPSNGNPAAPSAVASAFPESTIDENPDVQWDQKIPLIGPAEPILFPLPEHCRFPGIECVMGLGLRSSGKLHCFPIVVPRRIWQPGAPEGRISFGQGLVKLEIFDFLNDTATLQVLATKPQYSSMATVDVRDLRFRLVSPVGDIFTSWTPFQRGLGVSKLELSVPLEKHLSTESIAESLVFVELAGEYKARLSAADVVVTTEAVRHIVAEIASSLATKSSDCKLLFVPVGGAALSRNSEDRQSNLSLIMRIDVRLGHQIPIEELTVILNSVLNSAVVKTAQFDPKATVVFAGESGLRLEVAMNRINELSTDEFSEIERLLRVYTMNASSESEASGKALSAYGITASKSDSSSHSDMKASDVFSRDQEVSRILNALRGDVRSLTTYDLRRVLAFQENGTNSHRIERGSFRTGIVPFRTLVGLPTHSTSTPARNVPSTIPLKINVTQISGHSARGVQNEWTGSKAMHSPLVKIWVKPILPADVQLGLRAYCHSRDTGDSQVIDLWEGATLGNCRTQIEGVSFELVGADAHLFSVRYRAHLSCLGDTAIHADGEYCGTRGQHLAMEALWIEIVQK